MRSSYFFIVLQAKSNHSKCGKHKKARSCLIFAGNTGNPYVRTDTAAVIRPTALLDNVKVECYGQLMSLLEVATLAAPDAYLLTVQLWDKTLIPTIEKAIQISDIGVRNVRKEFHNQLRSVV